MNAVQVQDVKCLQGLYKQGRCMVNDGVRFYLNSYNYIYTVYTLPGCCDNSTRIIIMIRLCDDSVLRKQQGLIYI